MSKNSDKSKSFVCCGLFQLFVRCTDVWAAAAAADAVINGRRARTDDICWTMGITRLRWASGRRNDGATGAERENGRAGRLVTELAWVISAAPPSSASVGRLITGVVRRPAVDHASSSHLPVTEQRASVCVTLTSPRLASPAAEPAVRPSSSGRVTNGNPARALICEDLAYTWVL